MPTGNPVVAIESDTIIVLLNLWLPDLFESEKRSIVSIVNCFHFRRHQLPVEEDQLIKI